MRNPDRLDTFYEEIKELHKTTYPDWRIMQFWLNFMGWIASEKRIDPFFPEDGQMIEFLREYLGKDRRTELVNNHIEGISKEGE